MVRAGESFREKRSVACNCDEAYRGNGLFRIKCWVALGFGDYYWLRGQAKGGGIGEEDRWETVG